MKYFIVTPVRNEEKNLPALIESVKEQTVKPVLWVIVDDGSTDTTPLIIDKAKEEYKWIHNIRLENKKRRDLHQVAHVIKKGLDYAIGYCDKNQIRYEYLGVIDGDMIPKKRFFEKLIRKFDDDPKLGIAGGGVYYYNNKGKLMCEENKKDRPIGGGRLWRRECFEECGGIMSRGSWDSISNIKAITKGWKIGGFNDIKIIQSRKTSSASGLWKGWIIKGESSYFLGYHPFWVLMKGLKYSFKSPYYIGLAHMYGYFKDFLLQKEQVDDEEVKRYYWDMPKQEIWGIITSIYQKLKK